MHKPQTVALFGASVTEQSLEDSYWSVLKTEEAKRRIEGQVPHLDFVRLTFASSQFSNAGLMNLDHLLALRPDIVVLDWLSTDEVDTDGPLVDFVFGQLRRAGVQIICTSFLRADTWEAVTPLYGKMFQAARRHGASFLDMRSACDASGLRWQDLTRDGVHTNAAGASFYAKAILQEIDDRLSGAPPARTAHPSFWQDDRLPLREAAASLDQLPPVGMSFFYIGTELRLSPGQRLTFHIAPCGMEERGASLWCRQSVGPFSPVIEARSSGGETARTCLLDEWCHYTRFAFKPLIERLTLHGNKPQAVTVRIAEVDPNGFVNVAAVHAAATLPAERLVRMHERFCCVNGMITAVELG